MPKSRLQSISREEFDKRLDAFNERRATELRHEDDELTQIEQLLAQYERTLEEIEVRIRSNVGVPPHSMLLRKRLLELANKTAEMAASL